METFSMKALFGFSYHGSTNKNLLDEIRIGKYRRAAMKHSESIKSHATRMCYCG